MQCLEWLRGEDWDVEGELESLLLAQKQKKKATTEEQEEEQKPPISGGGEEGRGGKGGLEEEEEEEGDGGKSVDRDRIPPIDFHACKKRQRPRPPFPLFQVPAPNFSPRKKD